MHNAGKQKLETISRAFQSRFYVLFNVHKKRQKYKKCTTNDRAIRKCRKVSKCTRDGMSHISQADISRTEKLHTLPIWPLTRFAHVLNRQSLPHCKRSHHTSQRRHQPHRTGHVVHAWLPLGQRLRQELRWWWRRRVGGLSCRALLTRRLSTRPTVPLPGARRPPGHSGVNVGSPSAPVVEQHICEIPSSHLTVCVLYVCVCVCVWGGGGVKLTGPLVEHFPVFDLSFKIASDQQISIHARTAAVSHNNINNLPAFRNVAGRM